MAALLYSGDPNVPPPIGFLDWPGTFFGMVNPVRSAVYPRMLVMDEVYREGFYTWDLLYEWSMDELNVAGETLGGPYFESPDPASAPAGYTEVGPDVLVGDGELYWYVLQPQFSAFTNESLGTLDSAVIDTSARSNWDMYAGQEVYDVETDGSFFAPGLGWSFHEDPLSDGELMPRWCPGQPESQ